MLKQLLKTSIAPTSPHNMRGDAGYVRDISAYGLRIITKKWKVAISTFPEPAGKSS